MRVQSEYVINAQSRKPFLRLTKTSGDTSQGKGGKCFEESDTPCANRDGSFGNYHDGVADWCYDNHSIGDAVDNERTMDRYCKKCTSNSAMHSFRSARTKTRKASTKIAEEAT